MMIVKKQPKWNLTYRTFKTSYERETYLFVKYELSKSDISTFAKLSISSHDLHIEKGRHRKTMLSEIKRFLCNVAVEDEKYVFMECDSISTYRNKFLMN